MDRDTTTAMEVMETGGQEGSVTLGGSHVDEDLPSHGTWVRPEPNLTTLPEKGWEEGRVAVMPSAGGPVNLLDTAKEGRRERRRSQKFIDLCARFEEAGKSEETEQMSQSEKFGNRSEDTNILNGVSISKTDILKGPQHSTFSSLVDNWETKSKIPARKPRFRQRKLTFTNGGLSLVETGTNRKRGGNEDNGSAGKRCRWGS